MADGKVVIVDDDELVLRSTMVALEDWAVQRQVELVPCASGSEVLALLERESDSISVVLSDLRMPAMKGSELLQRVSERYPEIVTILVTGYGDLTDIAEAVQSGISSFVVKPWTRDYLTRELDKALHYRALRRENRRFLAALKEDLHWGGELQRALLRLDLPTSPGASYSLTSIPLPEFQCGGDYHDVVTIGDNQTMFMVGDVEGHGVKAAFMTFFLRAAIRQGYLAANLQPFPSGLLAWLNRLICHELGSLPSLLISFASCMLRESPPMLTYASARHLPVYRVRGQEAAPLRERGMGLGFDPSAAYTDHTCDLLPGDRVVLHTDGMRELGPSIRIGDDEFADILVRAMGAPDYNAAVLAAVRARSSTAALTDDATLLTATIA